MPCLASVFRHQDAPAPRYSALALSRKLFFACGYQSSLSLSSINKNNLLLLLVKSLPQCLCVSQKMNDGESILFLSLESSHRTCDPNTSDAIQFPTTYSLPQPPQPVNRLGHSGNPCRVGCNLAQNCFSHYDHATCCTLASACSI